MSTSVTDSSDSDSDSTQDSEELKMKALRKEMRREKKGKFTKSNCCTSETESEEYKMKEEGDKKPKIHKEDKIGLTIEVHERSPRKLSSAKQGSTPEAGDHSDSQEHPLHHPQPNISPRPQVSPRQLTTHETPDSTPERRTKRLKSSPMAISKKEKPSKTEQASSQGKQKYADGYPNTGSPSFYIPRIASGEGRRRKSKSAKRMSTGSPEKKKNVEGSKELKDKDPEEAGDTSSIFIKLSQRNREEKEEGEEARERKLKQLQEEKEEKSFFNIGSMKRKKEGTPSTGILYKFSHPLKTSKVSTFADCWLRNFYAHVILIF
jgi:hypothetical protein